MDGHTKLTLLLARVLISDPGCWTAGVLARDRASRPVSPLDDKAVSWCARGAIYRVVGGDVEAFRRAIRVLEDASLALYGASMCAVNDGPSAFAHEAVLSAFDQAVDALALAGRVFGLATSPSDKSLDVLEILGLASSPARRAPCVDLTGVDLGTGEPQFALEDEDVARIAART